MRMGWFRPVHAKPIGSQEVRALLVARKQLLVRNTVKAERLLGELCVGICES
jgi:hypothetical protein